MRSCEVAGFTLTESLYPPNLRMPHHLHELASFSFVLHGSYAETYDSRTRACASSSLIFHPPGEMHAVTFDAATTRILNIAPDARRLAELRGHTPMLDRAAAFSRSEAAWLALRLYREFRQMDELSPLAIKGLAFEIMAETARRSRRTAAVPPRWLARVRECLRDQFTERVSLAQLAALAGVHPVHLAREFRKYYRCTVGEHVRALRVEYAARQISSTDAPLQGIAAAAGFSDQSHFVRTFKSVLGVTPSDYRKFVRSR